MLVYDRCQNNLSYIADLRQKSGLVRGLEKTYSKKWNIDQLFLEDYVRRKHFMNDFFNFTIADVQ